MKSKFTQNDWAFHKLRDSEITAAWHWESQREAGSVSPAWFALGSEQKSQLVQYCAGLSGIREIDSTALERNAEYLVMHEAGHCNSPLQVHVLEIDWSKGKAALAEDFKAWLQNHQGEKARRDWDAFADKGGRKSSPRSWLVDLAIYRADMAGLSPRKAAIRFEPLRKWSLVAETKDNKFAPHHWRAACNKTVARLAEIKSFPLASILRLKH